MHVLCSCFDFLNTITWKLSLFSMPFSHRSMIINNLTNPTSSASETDPKQLVPSQQDSVSGSEEKTEEIEEQATTKNSSSSEPKIYVKNWYGNLSNVSSIAPPGEHPSVLPTQSPAEGVPGSLREGGLSEWSDRQGGTPHSDVSAAVPQHCDHHPAGPVAMVPQGGNASQVTGLPNNSGTAGDLRRTGAIPKRGRSEAFQSSIPQQPGSRPYTNRTVAVGPGANRETPSYISLEGATCPQYREDQETRNGSTSESPAARASEAQSGRGSSRSLGGELPPPVPESNQSVNETEEWEYLS